MAVIPAQTATGTSNLASTTATFANNTITGNTIVVVIGNSSVTSGDVSSVTDSQGNVYQKAFTTDNASIGDLEVWYSAGILGGATPTVTVAYTTGVSAAVIAREYWGLYIPSQNPFDQQTSTTGNSTTPSSGNVQLKQPVELLIGAILTPLNTTYSLGAGFGNLTSLNGSVTVSVAMEDQYVTAIGPWAATFGVGASALQWVCGIVTFYQAPAGTTTSTSFTTSTSSSSTSISSTSSSISSTSSSTSISSTSTSLSSTSSSISSTSSSTSSTSISSTSSSTSISSTSTSISSTSTSSTSQSSTSTSISISSTSTSFSSTSTSLSSTSSSISSTSVSSTSSSSSTSTTTLPPLYLDNSYQDVVTPITLDSVSSGSDTTTSPLTWNHTIGPGNNRLLVVAVAVNGGVQGTFSGVTFNGVAMNEVVVKQGANNSGGFNSEVSLWFLHNPPVGRFTVSASWSDSSLPDAAGVSMSYFGAAQVDTADATASATGLTQGITSVPITTVAPGAWIVSAINYVSDATSNNTVVSTNGIRRQFQYMSTNFTGIMEAADTNTYAPPGSNIFTFMTRRGSAGLNDLFTMVAASIKPVTITNTDLANPYTIPNYSNASVDDGDYFIKTGSAYIIEEFKNTHQNNTDNIVVSWKGRTTLAPSKSPVFLQIYNQNTSAWETLATQAVVPPDTDFALTGTQSTNLSNYYDSTNTVSCRVYQLVV